MSQIAYLQAQTIVCAQISLHWGTRGNFSKYGNVVCIYPEHGDGEKGVMPYDIIAMIGTRDQSCWLAEPCKILVWGVSGAVWQPHTNGLGDHKVHVQFENCAKVGC